MKIAAGVFAIIVALVNLVGGFGYMAGGGLAAGLGAASEEIARQGAAQGASESETTELSEAGGMLAVGGAAIAAFGIFLMVLGGLEIAGGVLLFMSKAATFVLVVGVLELLATVASGLMTGFGIMSAFSIIAGILIIVGARAIKAGGEAMDTADATA